MSRLTVDAYRRLGLPLDTTCYGLDDGGRAVYLADHIRAGRFDVVVACQGVQHAYRALALLSPGERPPLVEHGGLVSEVGRTPKELTAAYVGVSRAIVEVAARALKDPTRARLIPSMVDLREYAGQSPASRAETRRRFGFGPQHRVAGWVGRLDRKKRVEDFVAAAALLHARHPETRFLLVGGPDAFMPEYAAELEAQVVARGLGEVMVFTGDRSDVPRLMEAMDALAWLSEGEGLPHVLLEAGAARLAVVATPDGGAPDVVVDGESGLLVPYRDPPAVAAALERLLTDRPFARRLGASLRRTIERTYAADVVCAAWEALFQDLARPGRDVARLDVARRTPHVPSPPLPPASIALVPGLEAGHRRTAEPPVLARPTSRPGTWDLGPGTRDPGPGT
jgi:glycosyltransferase involved in cell wall biosynthesis